MKWSGPVMFFLVIVLVIAATFAAMGCILFVLAYGYLMSFF